ncbi:MAG: uracil-DNA glycosylase [Deltaproteobacteria bacterium]|nr:uracil-DNA glycosylase [Deltaproteobacteria bacterium]MBN2670830.1 uracil-DNA glycosylase [Deltaproteobacteria bacterium]
MSREDSIAALADALRARIDWERELGAEGYEATPPNRSLPESARPESPGRESAGEVLKPAPTSSVVAPTTDKSKAHALSELKFQLENCTQCALHQKRNRIVFSDGTMNARLAFVGEFPTTEEDMISLPFIGARGHLLNKIILAIEERRETCYLCHVVKCAPGQNALPSQSQVRTCGAHLWQQLRLVSPKVVVALGQTAASFLLETDTPIDTLRGTAVEKNGLQIMPTFSLEHMLNTPASKREVWEDMKKAKAMLQQ